MKRSARLPKGMGRAKKYSVFYAYFKTRKRRALSGGNSMQI
jgi:hypothetical protein